MANSRQAVDEQQPMKAFGPMCRYADEIEIPCHIQKVRSTQYTSVTASI